MEATDSTRPPPVTTGMSRGQSVPVSGSRMVSSTFSSSLIRKVYESFAARRRGTITEDFFMSFLLLFVPLFIVTDYLSNNVTKDFFEKLKRFSIKDRERAENLIRFNLLQQDKSKIDETITSFRRACDTGLTKDLSDSDVKMLMEQLKSIMNISFCNIVEEPEQNLFPASQIETIKYLVSCLNSNKKNSLLITTHSPFVLSALNNFIFAAKLSSDEIPENLHIYSKDFTAYLVQDGNIIDIFDKKYGLIDTTVIDDCATLLNTQYDSIYNQEIKNE